MHAASLLRQKKEAYMQPVGNMLVHLLKAHFYYLVS